jgi:hypothetical protein
MTRVVSFVTAEALGIEPGDVTVDLDVADGAMAVTVHVPVRALSGEADRTGAQSAEAERAEAESADAESAVADHQARAEQSREQISSIASELLGTRISEVRVRLTASRIRLPRLSD